MNPIEFLRRLGEAYVLFLIVIPIVLITQFFYNFRNADVAKKISLEKMDVIIIRENNDELKEHLIEACSFALQEKPVLVVADGDSIRKWYPVDPNKYGGSPKPKYIEVFEDKEYPFKSVIYASFGGNQPVEQLRNWLKSNLYSDADRKLEWEGLTPREEWGYPGRMHTTNWLSKRGESTIGIQGILQSTYSILVWDGNSIQDCGSSKPFLTAFSKETKRLSK